MSHYNSREHHGSDHYPLDVKTRAGLHRLRYGHETIGSCFSRNALAKLAGSVVMRGLPDSYAGRNLLASAKGVYGAQSGLS